MSFNTFKANNPHIKNLLGIFRNVSPLLLKTTQPALSESHESHSHLHWKIFLDFWSSTDSLLTLYIYNKKNLCDNVIMNLKISKHKVIQAFDHQRRQAFSDGTEDGSLQFDAMHCQHKVCALYKTI